MTRVSVVVPVKDGARYLGQLIEAVHSSGDVELLAIDSGSRDGSVELARAAGATVHEIPPGEFGHGRTRNLGMELTSGEVVCFLTQDAVPAAGWLDAHLEALALGERVGASYGPHLPWPDTSPMIARELEQFFATMSADGGPALQRRGDLTFLSNVNAAYRRECWEEIRFDEVAYAEDQAFGRAMLEAGWTKAYHPRAAVIHAHDYGPVEFARRYFDEYRGLRETIGHIEPARPGRALRDVRAGVAADRRWMSEHRWPAGRRAAWTARSLLHHTSRKAAAIAATRPERLPAGLERRLSLEGRTSVARNASQRAEAGRPATPPARGALAVPRYAAILRYAEHGPAPLAPRAAGAAERDRLHLAFLVPPFRRGSGGHSSIFQLILRLERMGHTCTVWVLDPSGDAHVDRAGVIRRNIVDWFAPIQAPVFTDLADWHGADVAVATGWDTAHQVAILPGCGGRAYLIHDHEPEFFATSAERLWAEQTYSLGLYPISGSDWLRDLVAERYGTPGTSFRFGVDHGTYRVLPVRRRQDTVLFYSRAATPRRAVPLGVLALEELCARRPDTRVVGFGQHDALRAGFASESLGVASPARLAEAYAEATVGLCLSLTNYSLIPQEMMACGLPCVDVAGLSSEAVFGADGPVELAEPDPVAIADAIERLLDGGDRWRHRSEAGLAFVADASWDIAARQVEGGLREALRASASSARA
ncbi:MAG TPA: glycosyltransferase [Solirubrobacteraceae bacterium]|nr:glycosyltransferase [Solirubrobacteraceae bacterium]